MLQPLDSVANLHSGVPRPAGFEFRGPIR